MIIIAKVVLGIGALYILANIIGLFIQANRYDKSSWIEIGHPVEWGDRFEVLQRVERHPQAVNQTTSEGIEKWGGG